MHVPHAGSDLTSTTHITYPLTQMPRRSARNMVVAAAYNFSKVPVHCQSRIERHTERSLIDVAKRQYCPRNVKLIADKILSR